MAKTEISLSAIPDRMINNGECKSKIVLSLKEKGKPLAGAWAYIASSDGRLYGLNDTKVERDKRADLEVLKVKTNREGQASMGLDLPNRVGSVHLAGGKKHKDVVEAVHRAVANNPKVPKDVATKTVLLVADKPAEMVLEPEQESIIADGVSTMMVYAVVRDRYGNPVEGEEISFTTDLGTMEEGDNAITDAEGRARVSISSRQVGTARVRAVNRYKSWIEEILPGTEDKDDILSGVFSQKASQRSAGGKEGSLSAETTIRFVASKPSSLVLAVDKGTVPADGRTEARVEAEVKDEFGNPVAGERMIFETDLGEVRPSGEITTDDEGKASVALVSHRVGAASVRARTLGENALLSAAEVLFEAASPAKIVLSPDRTTFIADGEDECLLTAQVEDEMGNPVPEREVVFETDLGTILPEGSRPADKEGRAEVRVSSRIAGTARVRAKCGEAEASVEISFRPGKASSVAISLNPTLEQTWKERIPTGHWTRLQEALRHMGERRFADAIAILEAEEETMKNTCNLAGLCDLAYSYQQYGRKADAEKLYRYIVGRNGSKKEVRVKALEPKDYLINAAVTDANGNEVPDLEVEFEANFGWIPEDHRKGRTNSVGAASSLVITFSPSGVSEMEFAWVNLGLMKENALDYAGAERCYRSALQSMPESVRALEALGSVLVKTGETDMAKRCFYNLARIFSRRGNLSRALEYYGKAIELDPKYAKALAGYGAASLRLGEIGRAQRYLEESVKLDRSLKAALANLGLLYYLTGKFDKAIPLNRRALKIDPEFKPALLNLHQIHMAKGEREKAREYAAMIKGLGG